jgi:NitT/TauT family transport system substrate-binding protein
MLSRNLHCAAGGVSAFATLWAKTKGSLDVKAVAGMISMPLCLNARNLDVKTVKNFTEKDNLALPAVTVSAQG